MRTEINSKKRGIVSNNFRKLLVNVVIVGLATISLFVETSAAVGAKWRSANSQLETMPEKKLREVNFYTALKRELSARAQRIKDVCRRRNKFEKRILEDYGAMFIADKSVLTPPVCVFADEAAVEQFQASTDIVKEKIGGVEIELQAAAMRALLAARAEALRANLDITPRDGAEAARRSYADTLRLWDSRFSPALAHWTTNGKIKSKKADKLKGLLLAEQVKAVLKLEKREIFFSKDFSKSILYSVAAPGCSQHLSLIAFDASEFNDERVRQILARHGWFRTVNNDLPHFTFLGRREAELPQFGLKRLDTKYGEFWIPNVEG